MESPLSRFFARQCTVWRPLLSEYLENGQIRNCSAIDSLHVAVWVKSISNCCISLHLKCVLFFFFLLVLCGRREGKLERKGRDQKCSKPKPGSTTPKCGDVQCMRETWALHVSADSSPAPQPGELAGVWQHGCFTTSLSAGGGFIPNVPFNVRVPAIHRTALSFLLLPVT